MIEHGTFTLYTPDLAQLPPDAMTRKWLKIGALFIRNEVGVDWYEIAHRGPTGKNFVMLAQDGRVASVGKDPERMFPNEHRVLETDLPVEMGWYLVGDTFLPQLPVPEIPMSQNEAPVDV